MLVFTLDNTTLSTTNATIPVSSAISQRIAEVRLVEITHQRRRKRSATDLQLKQTASYFKLKYFSG